MIPVNVDATSANWEMLAGRPKFLDETLALSLIRPAGTFSPWNGEKGAPTPSIIAVVIPVVAGRGVDAAVAVLVAAELVAAALRRSR